MATKTNLSLSPPIHQINEEYIKEWLVLGPFFPNDLEMDFLAEVNGDANIQPQEGDTVGFDTQSYSTQATEDGRELTWKRYNSSSDIIDFLDAIGDYKNATAYAFCVLKSEVEGDAEIRLGSEFGFAAWINGKQVHSDYWGSRLIRDMFVFETHLKAGTNRCLIKVSHKSGNWRFRVRMTMLHPNRSVISGVVTDEKGKSIYKTDVRLKQDDSEIAQSTTDGSGSYRLNIYPVRGQYALSATKDDLGYRHSGLRLTEGERRTLNLTLKEAISIEGMLMMLDDTTPHVAVPVQAIRTRSGDPCGRPIATTLSEKSGKYRLTNLEPGQYQVRCQILNGYVYYGASANDDGIEERRAEIGEEVGEILQVSEDKTLKDIDFRFASFKKGTWKNYDTLDGLAHNAVSKIYRAPDGILWFGTYGGGVSRYDGKEFETFTTKDGLANNTVWDIYCDPDGVMWFATFGGVSRYDGKEFKNFTTEDGLGSNTVHTIHRDADGMMWFGTWDGGSPVTMERSLKTSPQKMGCRV